MTDRDFTTFTFQVSSLLATMTRIKDCCESDHSRILRELKSRGVDYADFMDLCIALKNIAKPFTDTPSR